MKNFLIAPFIYHGMLWMAIPLIINFLTMEFYFARYKTDELGWNTATGNSLVLFFVFLDTIRQIYSEYNWNFLFQENLSIALPAVLLVGFLGLFLFVLNFFREIPKSVAFFISSALTINYIAYFAVYAVYTEAQLGIHDLIAIAILFLLLMVLFWIFKMVFPEAKIAENLPKFKE